MTMRMGDTCGHASEKGIVTSMQHTSGALTDAVALAWFCSWPSASSPPVVCRCVCVCVCELQGLTPSIHVSKAASRRTKKSILARLQGIDAWPFAIALAGQATQL
jgi:hypothetical protein